MGRDAQLTSMQTRRQKCLGANCPRKIPGHCLGELSRVIVRAIVSKCLRENVWGIIRGNVGGMSLSGENVWQFVQGMSGSWCRITCVYVQRLWFVPPWLTHRHTQLLTGYTISSARRAEMSDPPDNNNVDTCTWLITTYTRSSLSFSSLIFIIFLLAAANKRHSSSSSYTPHNSYSLSMQ